jgi:hypothetical protein
MHEYTVRQLNDQRLAEFDSEARASRLRHEARSHRSSTGPAERGGSPLGFDLAGRLRNHIGRLFVRARDARPARDGREATIDAVVHRWGT